MDILIQLANKESGVQSSTDSSIRSLRIFSSHKCIYDKEAKSFIHYIVVIGYSGGGCQEECFYKIGGSNLEKSTIQISTSSGDSFFHYTFSNQNLVQLETELNHLDKQIQGEILDSISKYLSYDGELDYFFFDNSSNSVTNGFLIIDKFPMRILKFLKNVYWPFSTHW